MADWIDKAQDLPIIKQFGDLLNFLSGKRDTDRAARQMLAALGQARGAIQGGADKAMSYQEPYLKNAGADFDQLRSLVQSGFFQQPYGRSFQSQSFQGPSFALNPSQGKASFSSWQPQGGPAGFNPMALPQMPQFQPPAAPQAGPMVRPNAAPRETMGDLVPMMEQGIRNVTYQNLPGQGTSFSPVSPMDTIVNQGKAPDPLQKLLPSSLQKQLSPAEYLRLNGYRGGSGPTAPYGNPYSGRSF